MITDETNPADNTIVSDDAAYTDSSTAKTVKIVTDEEIVTVDEKADEVSDSPDTNDNIQSKSDIDNSFYIDFISDELFAKMYGKSYKTDCTVPTEDLRYVHILHYTLDGCTKEGELVCNKEIAEDLLQIFRQLYDISYPIEKVKLIDEYDADDESSMADNNTSCFNYRVISGTTTISKHGLGMAVDINPLYNPYVHTVDGILTTEPANASEYADRSKNFDYKITESDPAYLLFTEHGFTWGGSWKNSKDYQHFEK